MCQYFVPKNIFPEKSKRLPVCSEKLVMTSLTLKSQLAYYKEPVVLFFAEIGSYYNGKLRLGLPFVQHTRKTKGKCCISKVSRMLTLIIHETL